MGGRGSITLVRLAGIRVGVHPSWFAVLFVFILLFSSSFRSALGASEGVAYVTAVAAVGLFFVSIVVHELAHALVARRYGIEVRSIDLWLLGGVAQLGRDADGPRAELRIAAAGPLATAAIVLACLGLGLALVGSEELLDAAALTPGAGLAPGVVLLAWLASGNLVLLLFNLIPAFPLDGGRIVRAVIWSRTGDRRRAVRVASALGQGFGVLLMGLGVAALTVFGDLVTGLWGLFGGFLLRQAARAEQARSAFAERLDGLRVADLMDPEPVAVPADLPVERAREEFFLRYRYAWFPVVDGAGRFTGVLRPKRLDERPEDGGRPVGELLDPVGDRARVDPGAPIESLLALEPLRELGGVAAVDGDGVLRGVLGLEEVRRAVLSAARALPSAG